MNFGVEMQQQCNFNTIMRKKMPQAAPITLYMNAHGFKFSFYFWMARLQIYAI